jgi:pimeloyl-ACP methyl ester carboxylesterase
MTSAPGADPFATGLESWSPDPAVAPLPDGRAEPQGFIVAADGDVRLHFLDWGRPAGGDLALLVPGLLRPASTWAPVARRLAAAMRTSALDLRGQGLSDAPMHGYDPATLAGDIVTVAEGAGMPSGGRITLAGHGFGGIVAAWAAVRLADRCAGLVLVDGGWERLEVTAGVDVDEFLRGLDEPPEVLRTMDAYLADRCGFDPASWDADQERAARDAVVETAAGHVVRAVRPHVVGALVRAMFAYDPLSVLPDVTAPVTALVALGAGDPVPRLEELRRVAAARLGAGRLPIRVAEFGSVAHDLLRHRPAQVATAILSAADLASARPTTTGPDVARPAGPRATIARP